MASPASSQAKRVVVGAGGLLAAAILFQAYECRQGASAKTLTCAGSTFGRVYLVGILTVGMAFVADFAPGLVAPFAVAVVVGYVYKNPGVLSRLIAGPIKTAETTTPTRNPTRIDQRRNRAVAGLPD